MHDAAKVVYFPERVDLAWFHLQEVVLLSCSHTDSHCIKFRGKHLSFTLRSCQHTCRSSTLLDVVSDDADMLVAVRTSVFVPEADHVAELMHHNAKLIAVLPYGDGLGTTASPPHVGTTPAGGDTVQWPRPAVPAEQTLTRDCLWKLKIMQFWILRSRLLQFQAASQRCHLFLHVVLVSLLTLACGLGTSWEHYSWMGFLGPFGGSENKLQTLKYDYLIKVIWWTC